jgi:hypothetical protein
MNFLVPILAEADVDGAGAAMADETSYRLISFTAFAVVILAIFVWAAFIRKSKSKRRRIHKHHRHTWEQSGDGEKRRRHRHRRKLAPDLPQNPSLAASGGLPPRRADDVPPRGA